MIYRYSKSGTPIWCAACFIAFVLLTAEVLAGLQNLRDFSNFVSEL